MNRSIVYCALLALLLAAGPAAAQRSWTALGSTGTIDEASLGLYGTSTASLGFQGAAVGGVVAHYNVTNAWGGGFGDTPPWSTLEITYFDNSPSSAINASLIQVDRCTGALTVLCTINSVDAATNTCQSCTFPAGSVNFLNSNYHVQVRVARTTSQVSPQLIALRIR